MRRYVLKQRLNRNPVAAVLRKVAALVHIPHIPAKVGLGMVSSALVIGSGAVFAASQSAQPKPTSLQQTIQSGTQTDDSTLVNTNAEVNTTVTENSHSSPSVTQDNSESAGANNNVQTKIIVNGEGVSVPPNGQVHHSVTNADGSSTTVDVSNQTSGQNNASTNIYTNVQTNSFSAGITNSTTSQSGFHN